VSSNRDRLRNNDFRFLAVARTLPNRDWSRRSLCSEWTNHDVLAHLVVGCQVSAGTVVLEMARHRGSFDRSNARLAQRLAVQRTPSELFDDFEALIERPHGLGRVFPKRLLLGDHIIHELDIVLPLGLQPTIDAKAMTAVLETQVRVPNPFVPAAARARGLCLQATDTDWTYGEGGLCVSGMSAHLASALAGRSWALDHLSGDGVALLHSRG
jgi:uncharacterized protein (TIGR03083 family)